MNIAIEGIIFRTLYYVIFSPVPHAMGSCTTAHIRRVRATATCHGRLWLRLLELHQSSEILKLASHAHSIPINNSLTDYYDLRRRIKYIYWFELFLFKWQKRIKFLEKHEQSRKIMIIILLIYMAKCCYTRAAIQLKIFTKCIQDDWKLLICLYS